MGNGKSQLKFYLFSPGHHAVGPVRRCLHLFHDALKQVLIKVIVQNT